MVWVHLFKAIIHEAVIFYNGSSDTVLYKHIAD